MRPIDAVSLSEGIELHRQSTDQEYEMDRQWAVGYNAGLDRALYSIAYAKTIAPPPNDPLTLDELREMGGEPYWHVGLQEDSAPPHWSILDPFFAKHIENYGYGERWLAYRRRPENQKDFGGET